MKRAALWLLAVSIVLVVGFGLFNSDPVTPADYAEKYGGQSSTYAGILSDTRCERLWELHLLDMVEPGYRIAAADRYNEVC